MVNKGPRHGAIVIDHEPFSRNGPIQHSAALAIRSPVVGTLVGFTGGGGALIDLPAGQFSARSCVRLTSGDVGKDAVLLFEEGDTTLPIIIGLVQRPALDDDTAAPAKIGSSGATREVEIDGKRVEFTAKDSITLRCGDASITLSSDGKVVIRGTHVVSHAAGVNRIRGGSVQLN